MLVVDLVIVAFVNEAVFAEGELKGRVCFRVGDRAFGHRIVSIAL